MFGKWFGDWFHLWFGGTTPPFGLELPSDADYVVIVPAGERDATVRAESRSRAVPSLTRTVVARNELRTGTAASVNREGVI